MTAPRFIGRAAELATLDDHLAEGERLITIVGAPGVGKTALARELVRVSQEKGRSPDRAVFCDLTHATDRASIVRTVGQTLDPGLSLATIDDDVIVALGSALARSGPLLVVLDNVEQVAEHAHTTVSVWLALASEVRFVVTSRSPLYVQSERRLELAPLSTEIAGTEAEATSEAVELLLDRIERVRPELCQAASERAMLDAIAQHLDGIPLALELAAARVVVLGAAEVLARLPQALTFLSRRGVDPGSRHVSLQAALEWSWRLLSEREREVLAACALFGGSFSLAAAEAVADAASPGAATTVDVVQSLVEQSLLVRLPMTGTHHNEVRFSLYVVVREHARAKLRERGDAEANASWRHAAYHVAHGERWARDVDGPACRDALARLSTERANLVQAACWGLDAASVADGKGAEGAALGARALLALFRLVMMHGMASSDDALIDRAIAQPELSRPLRCRLLAARGWIRARSGRPSDAITDLEHARALAQADGDRAQDAWVTLELGTCAAIYSRWEMASDHLHASLALHRQLGDRCHQARALGDLGRIAQLRGDPAAGAALLGQALALFREAPHPIFEAFDRVSLGQCHLVRGDFDDAGHFLVEAERRFVALGTSTLAFLWSTPIAMLHHARGEHVQALARYEQAALRAELVNALPYRCQALGYGGLVLHEQGRLEEALASVSEALDILGPLNDQRLESLFLAFLATIHASAGRLRLAQEAFARAAERCPEERQQVTLGLLRLVLDISQARATGDPTRLQEQLRAVQHAMGTLPSPLLASSLDIRLALRVAAQAYQRALGDAGELAAPGDLGAGAAPSLIIHALGEWIQLSGGAVVDCRNRQAALRAVLITLAQRRIYAPGESVTAAQLVAAGWPGERILPDAAAARVRMAILTLRKLGLRATLETTTSGYRLSPEVVVTLEHRDGLSRRIADRGERMR